MVSGLTVGLKVQEVILMLRSRGINRQIRKCSRIKRPPNWEGVYAYIVDENEVVSTVMTSGVTTVEGNPL